MTAEVRFSIKGFVSEAEAEALKSAVQDLIRSIDTGLEIKKAYNLPDVLTASGMVTAFRNTYKHNLATIKGITGQEAVSGG